MPRRMRGNHGRRAPLSRSPDTRLRHLTYKDDVVVASKQEKTMRHKEPHKFVTGHLRTQPQHTIFGIHQGLAVPAPSSVYLHLLTVLQTGPHRPVSRQDHGGFGAY
ncbi:hypothetical protein L249_0674 [Ophiocordyceps polyrhachis-furcata BCC 54312]|uniref:Uncharacterized protein n=1 Tax=Ophiocordyceps polyrhachis-furcata BCC 54312 TaxID=1330021 RepID=A0A367LC56_9HYPO|nr:hypothetical protein L249_0674 [Ophiocordyceps polyrhachis-furcata BCC 54312]